ncbi:E3 ubiquitin-protein ligase RHA1B [Quillaja saponaria]|uniref:E3 ubiquitin-protein ligase RHA1B n=1 Tax=Quillaja saponaria TaxID=32244 RepID=A0AAD7PPT6_QUISA|nr:E3 ubiquitin-protein ligase RHA1B [Quillaja saponaria]
MGFPVGYTEVFFPNLFLHTLSLLGFIRNLIFLLFHFLGLSDFIETEVVWSDSHVRIPDEPPISALLIREFLPVIKYEDLAVSAVAGDLPESCAVCLYEFEGGEEIRWLTNCKHIFHRDCLDRWMDHDQKTCPLCRTPFVPDDMLAEFNQRLWAASGVSDFYSEFGSI